MPAGLVRNNCHFSSTTQRTLSMRRPVRALFTCVMLLAHLFIGVGGQALHQWQVCCGRLDSSKPSQSGVESRRACCHRHTCRRDIRSLTKSQAPKNSRQVSTSEFPAGSGHDPHTCWVCQLLAQPISSTVASVALPSSAEAPAPSAFITVTWQAEWWRPFASRAPPCV